MKSRKNLIIIALVVLVSVVGLSYAFFNYYMVSQRNLQLITGEIYLRLDDGTDEVMLLNAFPETREEARARNDNYITFTITGKNTTTNHDIHYEIDLNEGDPVAGRTRLKASDLRFDLVEIRGEDEVYVVWDESFENFDEKRIWVDHVFQNTTEEVERVYKLRMWISDDVLISDTDPNASYTTGEYKNSYATVKVSVFGDFNEKATDAACFTTEPSNVVNIQYDYVNYDLNITDETVESCKTIATETFYNMDVSDAQDGYQSFCEGTGTALSGAYIDRVVSMNFLDITDKFKAVNYVTNYVDETRYYTLDSSEDSVNACQNYLTTQYDSATAEKCAEQYKFKTLTGVLTADDVDYLEENGVLARDNEPKYSSVKIIDYDETCGSEVFIPTTIDGYRVSSISENSEMRVYDNNGFRGAFENKGLTKVVIPSHDIYIDVHAFENNKLRSIIVPTSSFYNYVNQGTYMKNALEYAYIPSNFKYVSSYAFKNNNLEKISFNGLKAIGSQAFANNNLTSVNIPSSVISIDYAAFNNNKLSDDEAFVYARTDMDNDGLAEIDSTTLISYGGVDTEVKIPSSVKKIVSRAFLEAKIDSVIIPEGVTEIGYLAFDDTNITSLNIPSTVIELTEDSIAVGKTLKTLTIGSGVTYIGSGAFKKIAGGNIYDGGLNPNLASVTIDKTCDEIKSIQASSSDTTIYYPWLSDTSPYTATGVTIYGANGEVCDAY